jgi:hypothetical protein
MAKRSLFVAALVMAILSPSLTGQSKPSVQGVWRVVETSGGRSGGTKTPQPGLVIFTAKHYAILRDTAQKPRPRPKDIANPTAAEALAAYQAFIAQGGTYQVKGNETLELRAGVAKNPPPDGAKYTLVTTYTFKLDGNNLTLTNVANTLQGKNPNPETIRLTRAE